MAYELSPRFGLSVYLHLSLPTTRHLINAVSVAYGNDQCGIANERNFILTSEVRSCTILRPKRHDVIVDYIWLMVTNWPSKQRSYNQLQCQG